jgi:hypothetical protein
MFCAPRVVFGGTDGVGSRFLVSLSRTRFPRYRGNQVQFSYFARPYSFSAVLMASTPVFMFCAPVLIFDGAEGVVSNLHVLRPELVFGGNEGVGSSFHILSSRSPFPRY